MLPGLHQEATTTKEGICLLQLSIALPFLLTSLIVLQVKRLYCTLVLAPITSPMHYFFMQHSKMYNKGRQVGLLCLLKQDLLASSMPCIVPFFVVRLWSSTVHSAQWNQSFYHKGS
ncbi:hypothetical protein ACHAW5_010976 [Stephanodiscus triporus]|uniref:Uncharacterized protein n=1 Tax=Stephanodiscus triporus TaxID=2934178 RepID=A0ABD3PRI2_9STRA